jgi:hypothetical protein
MNPLEIYVLTVCVLVIAYCLVSLKRRKPTPTPEPIPVFRTFNRRRVCGACMEPLADQDAYCKPCAAAWYPEGVVFENIRQQIDSIGSPK